MKTFPIQDYGRVPWEVAEQAYIGYVKQCGARQTLERLGERGGFGVEEMDDFFPEWRSTTQLIAKLREENIRLTNLSTRLSQEGHAMAVRCGTAEGRVEILKQENEKFTAVALANERHAQLYRDGLPGSEEIARAERVRDSKLKRLRSESDCYEQAYIKAERGRIQLGAQARGWKTAHKHLWRFVEETKFEDNEMSAGLYLEAEEAYADAIRVERDTTPPKEEENE